MNRNTIQFALGALFVTALITAQIISSKLLAVTLPVIGMVAMPGGTLAYAATFLATDTLNELYGRETATTVVRVGFLMNFVLLALVYVTIYWPRAGGVPQETFAGALAPSLNIVAGSLIAYLVSQHLDVSLFDWLKRYTSNRFLWVRNIGSTGISQFVDTVIFTTVAFIVAPTVFGVGNGVPLSVIPTIVIGQYVVKALIAVVDTPLVYGLVSLARRQTSHDATKVAN